MNSDIDTRRKRRRSPTPSSDSSSESSYSRDHKSRRKEKHSKHHLHSRSRERERSHNRSKSKSHHHSKDKKKKEKEKEKEKSSHKHSSKKDKKHSSHSKSKSKESKSDHSSTPDSRNENMMPNPMMYPMGMNKSMFFPPNPMIGMSIPPMKKFNGTTPMPMMVNPMVQGLTPPAGTLIPNLDGPADKIVKDQNFLNSDEKLFETIVHHEMSIKTLFADCQFSEKYLGTTLFKTIKKHIFDSNTVIFEEDKDGKKDNEGMPGENELIQQKIEDIKKKTHKINFGDLSSCVSKLLQIKQSEGSFDNNLLQNNGAPQVPVEVEA